MWKKFFIWLTSWISEKVPDEVKLRGDLEEMLRALDMKGDAVAFSMARAEEARDKLNSEVENYDALGLQAEQFLAQGDEEAARRLVTLQLQSQKEIEGLTADFQFLQYEAEQNIEAFQSMRTKVEERRKVLPKLQDDTRQIKEEREFRRISGKLSLASAQNSFDETARAIRMKKLQLRNKEFLEADPNAEIDSRIRRGLKGQELEAAMQTLRQKIGGAQTVVVKEVDPVSSAKKLLEAPRMTLALPSSTQKVLVKNSKGE